MTVGEAARAAFAGLKHLYLVWRVYRADNLRKVRLYE